MLLSVDTTPELSIISLVPVNAGAEVLAPRLHTVPGEHADPGLAGVRLAHTGQRLDLAARPRARALDALAAAEAGVGDRVPYRHPLGVLSAGAGAGAGAGQGQGQQQEGHRHPRPRHPPAA